MSSPKVITFAMASGIALGASGASLDSTVLQALTSEGSSWGAKSELVQKYRSGLPMSFFTSSSLKYEASETQNLTMSAEDKDRQYRFKAIQRSFLRHCDGLPNNKMKYMEYMANEMCGIPFRDNISEYNSIDATIDTIFKMNGGLTLTLSQFIYDEVDAPVVFSIHRGTELLVSAEMKLDELATTINEVLISESSANV